MNPYEVILILSIAIILSYIFEIITKKIKIPSVILLIASGMGIAYILGLYNYNYSNIIKLLPSLGVIGLMLIVLEGSLELEITKEKKFLILKSFLSATFNLLVITFLLAYFFKFYFGMSADKIYINAVPLAVISSAVAIPSVRNFTKTKKEFIVYESTFSDILGIMLFNFLLQNPIITNSSIQHFFAESFFTFIGSIVGTLFITLLFNKIKHKIKFFLIIAILGLVFAVGKMYHLSTLMLVFIFGLFLNNTETLMPKFLRKFINHDKLNSELNFMHLLTSETAFIFRTFFFLAFGLSINAASLLAVSKYEAAGIVILIIFVVRLISLSVISKKNVFPEVFVAPRGLITILLMLSIPENLRDPSLDNTFYLIIIIISLIMMTLGNLFSKEEKVNIKDDNYTIYNNMNITETIENI